MKVEYPVPFYENTPDNTHCFQAALRMVLKYFLPEQEYSWEELETITVKKKDGWTWPIAAMIWLSKNGFEIKDIELFDYLEFSKEGKKYLTDKFGSEVADAQDTFTDLPQEQRFASELTSYVHVEMRIPNTDDLRTLLTEGYLLICNINSAKLTGKEGYFPHAVVIKGYEDNTFILHNPGIPGEENQHASATLFEKAWAYPDETAKNILAIRRT